MSQLVLLGISAISLVGVLVILWIRFKPAIKKVAIPGLLPKQAGQSVDIVRFTYRLTDFKPELIPASAAGSTPPDLANLQTAADKESATAISSPPPSTSPSAPKAAQKESPATTQNATITESVAAESSGASAHKDNPISDPVNTQTDTHNRAVETKLLAQRTRSNRRAAYDNAFQRPNNPMVTTPVLS